MYEISVSGMFVASHQLRLPDGGLEPRHVHDWRVCVTLTGAKLDAQGMLIDFHEIKSRLDQLLGIMYDRNLNALPAFRTHQPSAENVARHISDQLSDLLPEGVRLSCVEIEEARDCIARYKPTL